MRNIHSLVSVLGSVLLAGACTLAPEELELSELTAKASPAIPTNAARSLAITASSVLQPCLTGVAGLTDCSATGESTFSLRRTLATMLATAGMPTTAPGESPMNVLARQLWDTHNTNAGTGLGTSLPQCDDVVDGAGHGLINGFPIQCPRNEGSMALLGTDLLTPASPAYFYPIALVNRLDLRDAAGTTCGEFRIIYGRKDALPVAPTGRALVIFEAALPNPRPALGAAGCQPIADLWAGLSDPAVTAASARSTLAAFYYTGVSLTYSDGVVVTTQPVMHFQNLGAVRGQVRTNGFMNGPNEARWNLREFKTQLSSTGRLFLRPEYVKANPWPGAFSAATGSDAFSTWFVSQVDKLIINDLNKFTLDDNPVFGAGQSDSQTGAIEGPTGDVTQFSNDYNLFATPALNTAVQARLTTLGSTLTPANVMNRATAMSCGGCHQHSNNDNLGGGLVWPPSAGFVHVNETPGAATAAPDAFGQPVRSFQRSAAMNNVFLPARVLDLRCVAFGECAALALTAGARHN